MKRRQIYIFILIASAVLLLAWGVVSNWSSIAASAREGLTAADGGECPTHFSPANICPDYWNTDANNNCIIPTTVLNSTANIQNDEFWKKGCCLWLDAADSAMVVSSTSGHVEKWTDKSKNHFVFEQTEPNPQLQPTYNAILNQHNVVSFTKSNQTCLACKYDPVSKQYNSTANAANNITPNAFSMFSVCQFADSTASGTVFCKSRYGNIGNGEIALFRGSGQRLNSIISTPETKTNNAAETPNANKWRLLETIFRANTVSLYENGVKLAQYNVAPGYSFPTNTYDMMLGGYCDISGHSFGSYQTVDVSSVNINSSETYKYLFQPAIDVKNTVVDSADGQYKLYIFKTDGSFSINSVDIENQLTPEQKNVLKTAKVKPTIGPINATILVVGGGGGGGYVKSRGNEGGGGGGGGSVEILQNVPIQMNIKYNAFVGKGGANGKNGGPSAVKVITNKMKPQMKGQSKPSPIIDTIVLANGGGHGGIGNGGGKSSNGGAFRGGGNGWGKKHGAGRTEPGHGNGGGAGYNQQGGGGGGGMGGAGEDGKTANGGAGGAGVKWNIDGDIYYGAGGGGGGNKNGGLGGIGGSKSGGTGGKIGSLNGTAAAIANSGSGGGGGAAKGGAGGAGSDGVIIVAFKKTDLTYDVRVDLATVQEIETQRTVETTPEPSMYFNGQIAEIVAFSGGDEMTDNMRYKIEAYLAWKWGLQNSFPDYINDHPAAQYFTSQNNLGKIKYDPSSPNYVDVNGNMMNDYQVGTTPGQYTINFNGDQWKTQATNESGGSLQCQWSKWATANGIVWTGINTQGTNTDPNAPMSVV